MVSLSVFFDGSSSHLSNYSSFSLFLLVLKRSWSIYI
jgi:hypothetical protein